MKMQQAVLAEVTEQVSVDFEEMPMIINDNECPSELPWETELQMDEVGSL